MFASPQLAEVSVACGVEPSTRRPLIGPSPSPYLSVSPPSSRVPSSHQLPRLNRPFLLAGTRTTFSFFVACVCEAGANDCFQDTPAEAAANQAAAAPKTEAAAEFLRPSWTRRCGGSEAHLLPACLQAHQLFSVIKVKVGVLDCSQAPSCFASAVISPAHTAVNHIWASVVVLTSIRTRVEQEQAVVFKPPERGLRLRSSPVVHTPRRLESFQPRKELRSLARFLEAWQRPQASIQVNFRRTSEEEAGQI